MLTVAVKRDKPEMTSDLCAGVPVTEPEIGLVVAMLDGAIDRILDPDRADGSV